MGFADLHIHSVHSHDGTCSIPAILKHTADHTHLDVIAITDHDKVTGLREAVALGPRYGIEVVPGCEISTAQGHLLALFIDQLIPAGLPLIETIRRVGGMGGLCVVPHPEAPGISGLRAHVIRAAVADPEIARILLGIETFNGGLVYPRTNAVAQALARELNMTSLGSSDAHILSMIGQGTTEFEGRSAADLRAALVAHATTAHASLGMQGPIVLGYWFPKFVLRKMGWVAWNAQPDAPLKYVRMKQALAGALLK
jgi:predicted metal-dependent phosphoesterase TrpH